MNPKFKQSFLFIGLWFFMTSALAQTKELFPIAQQHNLLLTKTKSLQRLSSGLQQIHHLQTSQWQTSHSSKTAIQEQWNTTFLIQDDQITVDLIAKTDPELLNDELRSLRFEKAAVFGKTVSGKINIADLEALASLEELQYARPVYRPARHIGIVDSQGDSAQYSDLGRVAHSIDGNGLKIGALSDSYNTLLGEVAGIVSGDLPGFGNPNGYTTPVTVLKEYSSIGSDEARGMVEIIHDVAPAAQIYARTAFEGEADFAQGIIDLEAAGCNVIVDDVSYFAEPFFQDGIIAQAVDQVVADGAIYFSAAGNSGNKSYEVAGFTDAGFTISGRPIHDFDPSSNVDYTQQITIPNGVSLSMTLQWDDPFGSLPGSIGSADTDLDIRLYDSSLTNLLAHSSDNNIATGDPLEILSYTNNTGAAISTNLIIIKYTGPSSGRMKYVCWTNSVTIDEYDTQSSTIIGHANSAGALAIGAVSWYNTPAYGAASPTINGFSAVGGTPILFDELGNSIATIVREKPEFAGPDGANTTFFGSDITADLDIHPNFFGTSASAPHAAAAAVLLVEMGASTRTEVLDAFINTSEDMEDPYTGGGDVGFDFATGYGMANAGAAITHFINFPVELIDFTVLPKEENGAILNWGTASEYNNKVFILEHRTEYGSFQEIAQIKGKGHSQAINQYRHELLNLRSGNHYFRLLQKDFDGTISDHGVVNLNIKGLDQSYWTYATNSGQAIAIESDQAAELEVLIFNAAGQIIKSNHFQVEPHERLVTEIDKHQFPKGIYFYQIREQRYRTEKTYTGKFIL